MKADASRMDTISLITHLMAAFGGGLIAWALCRSRHLR